MRVLQTIPGMSAKSGGPSTCTHDLLEGLFAIDGHTKLLTVKPSSPTQHNIGEGRPWLEEVENDYRTPFVISRNARLYMNKESYDLYHINALWMGLSHDTCKIAREKGMPYIISPHGMLYPTALKVHAWKKWILLNLWYKKDIHYACCLHATCYKEMEYCRAFGYMGPVAVIPNAVVMPECIDSIFDEKYTQIKNNSSKETKKYIGFLGRLHPIKKVEQVIYAMDLLQKKGLNVNELIEFQIMGKFDEEYEYWLRSEVKRLHLCDCVKFLGFVNGLEKYQRLASLSALMVPSAQENFGMIVPEALICGTPVYTSLGTPWEELIEFNAGWWRDNSIESIAGVLQEIISMSSLELLKMGSNGRSMIKEKYEQHKVASMMKTLYEWIIVEKMNKAKKPSFIFM